MPYPTVISYYTDDEVYRPSAERLERSLIKFGLPFVIVEVERMGDVHTMQKVKPYVIKKIMNIVDGPVVWIDADNEIIQEPVALKNVGMFDIVVARLNHIDWEINASVIGFNNSEKSKAIVQKWIESIESIDIESRGDQTYLHHILQKMAMTNGTTVGMFPETYHDTDMETAIIYQHHESIAGKELYG